VTRKEDASAYFSPVSGAYAQFRPTYPEALFDWLASIAPDRGTAWDCGCGTGQASVPLAARFDRVVATDAGENQIANAVAHDRVVYKVAPAEESGLPDASVDLTLVAQAMHWFDLDRFYVEVRRVSRPRAALVAVAYGLMTADPVLDTAIRHFYYGPVHAYWPEGRLHIEAGYKTLAFPFEKIDAPAFAIERDLTIDALLGYLGTWSAVTRYRQALGANPLDAFLPTLRRTWGERHTVRFRWPLTILAGRIS